MKKRTGDVAGYHARQETFLQELDEALTAADRVCIAYHGDADGIISAAQLSSYSDECYPGLPVDHAAFEQFREREYAAIREYYDAGALVILAEGYGLVPQFMEISDRALNIDHHPPACEIARYLNPREYALDPNPANCLVTWELLKDFIDDGYEAAAAFGSVMDYCLEPATAIIKKHERAWAPQEDIRDIFLACQYCGVWTNKIVARLAADPLPEHLLHDDALVMRRDAYREKLASHLTRALGAYRNTAGPVLLYELAKDELRISSPLATRLGDRISDKVIALAERDGDRVRVSFRNRGFDADIGALAGELCRALPAADGIGHAKAASARMNYADLPRFIAMLEQRLTAGGHQ